MRDFIVQMANKNIGSLCLFLSNVKNIKYLNFINDNIPIDVISRKLPERIFYFVRNESELLLCECGDHLSFIGYKNGYRTSCGSKACFVRKRKETCLKKWGVDNPKKSKDIIEKEKQNIINKWGGHYMLNEDIRKKFNNTMIENYGVEWAQQNKEISSKSKITYMKNPNRVEINKSRSESIKNKSLSEKELIMSNRIETIKKNWGSISNLYLYISDKIREESIKNWGVNHHLSHPEVIKKRVDNYKENITSKIKSKLPENIIYVDRKSNLNSSDNVIILKCLSCDSEFDINRQYLVNRTVVNSEICLKCNPRTSGTSGMEKELFDFISNNYNGEIIKSDKNLLNGKEIDIFLPELKLAFEFNGLYWQSDIYRDKYYHLKKTEKCLDRGVSLVHIWEDDWLYKNEIVKSIILNKLKLSYKIYARKCEVREVENSEVRQFLIKNHIQGFVGSRIKLGLYHNDELVSLMTFGLLRKSLSQKSVDQSYELLRFCNKLGTSVIGGAGKLFKHFIKSNSVESIISYSDSSRGVGDLYSKLGFKFVHDTDPNYYYVVANVRSHRFNFRKDKLISDGFDPSKTEVQIMKERGFYRVFDCGSKKWKFINSH